MGDGKEPQHQGCVHARMSLCRCMDRILTVTISYKKWPAIAMPKSCIPHHITETHKVTTSGWGEKWDIVWKTHCWSLLSINLLNCERFMSVFFSLAMCSRNVCCVQGHILHGHLSPHPAPTMEGNDIKWVCPLTTPNCHKPYDSALWFSGRRQARPCCSGGRIHGEGKSATLIKRVCVSPAMASGYMAKCECGSQEIPVSCTGVSLS